MSERRIEVCFSSSSAFSVVRSRFAAVPFGPLGSFRIAVAASLGGGKSLGTAHFGGEQWRVLSALWSRGEGLLARQNEGCPRVRIRSAQAGVTRGSEGALYPRMGQRLV